jgi:hypothetical protein
MVASCIWRDLLRGWSTPVGSYRLAAVERPWSLPWISLLKGKKDKIDLLSRHRPGASPMRQVPASPMRHLFRPAIAPSQVAACLACVRPQPNPLAEAAQAPATYWPD